MKQISKLFNQFKHAINYLYYIKHNFVKNVYPFKFIGESINPETKNVNLIYKLSGNPSLQKLELQKFLNDKNLINCFSPLDAFKIGEIAFNEIIKDGNLKKEHFNKIRNVMLSSTHDINRKVYNTNLTLEKIENTLDPFVNEITAKNFYACRMVDAKIFQDKTIIFYTILGKRDAFEKSLLKLIEDKSFIEKFHPTEAIKFGFISSGDKLFYLNRGNENANYNS